jgi:hypothetical protein
MYEAGDSGDEHCRHLAATTGIKCARQKSGQVNARGIRMARHGEKVTPFVVHRAVEVKWRSSASQREKWRTAEVEARHSSISLSSD